MHLYLTAETMTYLDNSFIEMTDLLKELCLIPAPSHKEAQDVPESPDC